MKKVNEKEEVKEQEEIEFNNGFVTALGLFYGHRAQFEAIRAFSDMRLYAATDHLADIEYPENIDNEIHSKVEEFLEKAFSLRLKIVTSKEVEEIFDTCKDLFKLIDERIFGLKVEIKHP